MNITSLRVCALIALSLLGGITTATAQLNLQAAGGFKYPIYNRQADNDADQNAESSLRALVTGQSASLHADGTVTVVEMRIFVLSPDRTTNLTARAPDCLVNKESNTATSTNALRVEAGQGQLLVTGRGFLCNLTNLTLHLSNDVQTTIQGTLLRSVRDAKPLTPEAALAAQATEPAGTNSPIKIDSEQMTLIAPSNVVIYVGNVHVDSAQMELTCQTLLIERATNGTIREIVATRDVVIKSKQGAGTAYGDRAVYATLDSGQTVMLYGSPARWTDGLRQGQAQVIELDLGNNLLQAEHGASVQLPRQNLDQTEWVLTPGTRPAPASGTNQNIIISAELLKVYLPMETRPGRSVVAQTNVVILNQADGSQATSDEAYYSELTSTLELTGHAAWGSQDRMIRAQQLFLDRTNRYFRASGDAYLRLPITTLRRQGGLNPANDGSANATNEPSGALEVYCDRYWYKEGVLQFTNQIRANLLETNRVTVRLSCRSLAVHGTNRVDEVYAQNDVHLEQLPFTLANGRMMQRWLDCQWLALINTNGQPDQLIARTNVAGGLYEIRPDQPEPIMTRLSAQTATAQFEAGTNALKQVLAEQDVVISQGLRTAKGQQGLYDVAAERLILTGEPTLVAPEGNITQAASIAYDIAENRFFSRDVRIESDRPPPKSIIKR